MLRKMLATVALKEFKPVITTAKGILSSLTGGKIYQEREKRGGGLELHV